MAPDSVGGAGSSLQTETGDFIKNRFTFVAGEVGRHVYEPNEPLAMLLLEPIRNLRWKERGREELASSCTAGTTFVIKAHQTLEILWPEPAEYLQITLPAVDNSIESAKCLGEGSVKTDGNIINFSSKQCFQISQLIIEQLREPEGVNQSYLASLYAVLVHLLQRNALAKETSTVMPTGLSSYAARQIEAYLKEKFRDPVSVPDMALALGLSAGHFATRFRESFGQTPHQYLMSLRLDEAERCLKDTEMPISMIAARLNFSSQSHLTTALRKYRRLTPGELRRRSSNLRYKP